MMGREESHQTRLLRQIVAGLTAVLLLAGTSAQAAQDIFIEMDGIPGESRDYQHTDAIEVLSLGWGMANEPAIRSGMGLTAGKLQINDLSFTHFVDKASPGLMHYCAMGRAIPEVRIFVRKAGEIPLEYVRITLQQVFVANIEAGASDRENRAIETVSLSFEKIRYEYTPQKDDGTGDRAIEMTWNVVTNSNKL